VLRFSCAPRSLTNDFQRIPDVRQDVDYGLEILSDPENPIIEYVRTSFAEKVSFKTHPALLPFMASMDIERNLGRLRMVPSGFAIFFPPYFLEQES
jgi:hypothetical protein